jgi:hypothetical protein
MILSWMPWKASVPLPWYCHGFHGRPQRSHPVHTSPPRPAQITNQVLD